MPKETNFFDSKEIGKKFPETSYSILIDAYLKDENSASIRIFRLYKDLAPHYHTQCDELLYLLQGKASFTIGDNPERNLNPGELVIFNRNVIHSVRPLGDVPALFLTADTPRRDPKDVHFVNPDDAKGVTFVSHLEGYEP